MQRALLIGYFLPAKHVPEEHWHVVLSQNSNTVVLGATLKLASTPLSRPSPDLKLEHDFCLRLPQTTFRETFLRSIAKDEARLLPDHLSLPLLKAYWYLTRGDQLPSDDSYVQASLVRQAWLKSEKENRLHSTAINEKDFEKHLVPNLNYLLLNDRQLTLDEAFRKYLVLISAGNLDVSDKAVLDQALQSFRESLTTWLVEQHIPFTDKASTTLPFTVISAALAKFKGLPDFFLAPDIPDNKLMNAVRELGLPDLDRISALVDCTVFGSAKDCLLIGTRSIYFGNAGKDGFLPFSDFLPRTFSASSEYEISLGGTLRASLAGSGLNAFALVEILDTVKAALRSQAGVGPKTSLKLTDLAGMRSLKKMLQEDVVTPLREPVKFQKYGLTIPNGILMYGPPGCGKTFIAQALAYELGYNFSEVSPGSIASSYAHGSTLRIKELFDNAALSAPCLVFVDEFDGLAPARTSLGGEQQFKSEEVNEWLTQIGACADRGILFVAATNIAEAIDPAILRTGRLDKKVYVGPPDLEAIEEMLLFHLRRRHTARDLDVQGFAIKIDGLGYSASDLKVLVDESARLAMKEDLAISYFHLEKAATEIVPPSIPGWQSHS